MAIIYDKEKQTFLYIQKNIVHIKFILKLIKIKLMVHSRQI